MKKRFFPILLLFALLVAQATENRSRADEYQTVDLPTNTVFQMAFEEAVPDEEAAALQSNLQRCLDASNHPLGIPDILPSSQNELSDA